MGTFRPRRRSWVTLPSRIPTLGLVAYFPFTRSDGTDFSGNQNNAYQTGSVYFNTYNGSFATGIPGIPYMVAPGSGNYLSVTNPGRGLPITTNRVTVSAWTSGATPT